MHNIILANFGFWFNLSIPVAIAFWMWRTHQEYILKEFGIQVAATLIYLFGIYWLLFATTTDLYNTEYHNGYAREINYYEKWTERYTTTECSGSGKIWSRKNR